MEFNNKDYCGTFEKIIVLPRQRFYLVFKRFFDLILSLIGFLFCLIPFVIISIVIKLDSPGPVLFKQKRIGKNGKIFNCLKFRTMKKDAVHDIAGYGYENMEEYVTKAGRFLRRTSFDELPQLLNVLVGSMSIVGYRPSQPSEMDLNSAREKFDMYQFKPGITGWAQVKGRDILAAIPELKAKYDAYYLKNISFWMDLKILFLTVTTVFTHKNIQEGKIDVPK